jgi:hypothetical protein
MVVGEVVSRLGILAKDMLTGLVGGIENPVNYTPLVLLITYKFN